MDLGNRFFRLARIVSYKSKSPVRIGAVLTKNRKVVSVGWNDMVQGHPIMHRRNPLKKTHAELDMILGVRRDDLENATVFIYRDQRNGNLGMCRPCSDCEYLMTRAGIRHVYYSDPIEINNIGYMDLKYPERIAV